MTGPEYNADPVSANEPGVDQLASQAQLRVDILDGETYDRVVAVQLRSAELQAQGVEQQVRANADYRSIAERSLALSERIAVALERIAAAISVDAEAES